MIARLTRRHTYIKMKLHTAPPFRGAREGGRPVVSGRGGQPPPRGAAWTRAASTRQRAARDRIPGTGGGSVSEEKLVLVDEQNEPKWLIAARKLAAWLERHPRERQRAAKIYQKWGADAARGFLTKVSRVDLRALKRGDLRYLLSIEADHEGYERSREAHSLAWEAAGWNARPWYVSSGGVEGGSRRGPGGGKQNVAARQAYDAKRGGGK